MGLIGSVVGGALGIGGSIFGGISASKAMKKVKKNLQNQMKENQDWYDRRYNEDATQKADAQALLTQTEESIKNRNKQAVMGGTDESVAAAKAANNKALTDVVSNINAAAVKEKSDIENRYLDTKSSLNSQLQQLEGQKAQAISQAIQGVSGAAASMSF